MPGLRGCSGPPSKAKPSKYCGSECFLFLQFWNPRGEACWSASSLCTKPSPLWEGGPSRATLCSLCSCRFPPQQNLYQNKIRKPLQCAHLLQDFLCSFVQRLPQDFPSEPRFPLSSLYNAGNGPGICRSGGSLHQNPVRTVPPKLF